MLAAQLQSAAAAAVMLSGAVRVLILINYTVA